MKIKIYNPTDHSFEKEFPKTWQHSARAKGEKPRLMQLMKRRLVHQGKKVSEGKKVAILENQEPLHSHPKITPSICKGEGILYVNPKERKDQVEQQEEGNRRKKKGRTPRHLRSLQGTAPKKGTTTSRR